MRFFEYENGRIEIDTEKTDYERIIVYPQYQTGETFEDKVVKLYLAFMKE